jgi:hypothetical protein
MEGLSSEKTIDGYIFFVYSNEKEKKLDDLKIFHLIARMLFTRHLNIAEVDEVR